MRLLNYSHKLSSEAHALLVSMVGAEVEEKVISVDLDFDSDMVGQLREVLLPLVHGVEWDLIIPPAHASAAIVVGHTIAQMSTLPSLVTMKGVGTPRRYVPAQVIPLHHIWKF